MQQHPQKYYRVGETCGFLAINNGSNPPTITYPTKNDIKPAIVIKL